MDLSRFLVVFLGISVFLYGIWLLFLWTVQAKQLQYLKNSSPVELATLWQLYWETIPAISFVVLAEIEGFGLHNTPLLSPFSKIPCVFYTLKVIRKGKYVKTKKFYEEIVYEQQTKSDFFIQDETETIKIGVKTNNISDKYWEMIPKEILRNRVFSLPENWHIQNSLPEGIITVEYLIEEQVVTLHNNFYIFGEIRPQENGLWIDKPLHHNYEPFIYAGGKEIFLKDFKAKIFAEKMQWVGFLVLGGGLVMMGFWIF